MRIARRHGRWLIAAAAVALVCLLRATGALQPLENAAADARARLLVREVPSDIVIIGIDGRSLEELESWPWGRHVHANLLKNIFAGDAAAPRRVFFDIDFSSRQSQLTDAAFEGALAAARGPVFLTVFSQQTSGQRDATVVTPPLERFARHVELVAVNRVIESDSLTRTWRSSLPMGSERVPTVIDPQQRLEDDGEVIIDYSISRKSFREVSYVDVMEGRVPPGMFSGKDVFIGNVAVSLGDMVAVPVHGALPGVTVQALATETVTRGAPRLPPAWASVALLVIWSALAAIGFGQRWGRNGLVLAGLLAAIFAVGTLAFAGGRIWLDVAAPMGVAVISWLAATLRALDRQTRRALTYGLGLRRRDALLKSVVHSSADCIVCIDERGTVRTANPAAARLFGCANDDLVGESLGKFVSLMDGVLDHDALAQLHGVVRECDARTLKGESFPVEVTISRVRLSKERLFTAFVRDIRERRAQQRRLQHQATHDALTGLPNRSALTACLATAVRGGPQGGRVVVLMLDLCRFKEVNDALGHNVGDAVLCEVARRFEAVLGNRGLIARIGGDEFTVVLEQQEGRDLGAEVAHELADCLRRPIDVAGIAIEVGLSVGGARFPEDADDPQALLRVADVAMYSAKRRGTNYECYDAASDANSLRRLAIGGELRGAIAGNALELHYQPQVNLRTGKVESCEALVRWFHPVHGAISPAEFIAIAETTELIRPLTEWTLVCALEQIRAWQARDLTMRIAVNISARLLQDTAFPEQLGRLLRESGVAPELLELEITESAMMIDPARALRVVQELHGLGVPISIDDFGTGYSSLGYLRDLPVSALKLDQSFVRSMRENPGDRVIVESTAQMGHALKLELVAEGVEGEWEAAVLAAAGYHYAQGWHYSRAQPPEKCFQWISEFNAAREPPVLARSA